MTPTVFNQARKLLIYLAKAPYKQSRKFDGLCESLISNYGLQATTLSPSTVGEIPAKIPLRAKTANFTDFGF